MSYYKISKSQIFIIIILVFFFTGCSLGLSEKQVREMKSKDHAYLHIDFPDFDSQHKIYWYITLLHLDKIYIHKNFIDGEKYKIPIPIGDLEFEYSLKAEYSKSYKDDIVKYISGNGGELRDDKKNLSLKKIKKNQHIYLKIINIGKQYKSIGCLSGSIISIPVSKKYQEVALVVDRIEEGK